ncbi:DUF4435 domain-containing protein [Pseudoalteromonas xiamenensis]|uniref:DUF4435 domain-containing protein n=1 Tax=Pseudoalteromonas xiamenensis TaxID=882626 RepID=A0A975DJW9_9GAMM|nr:DUF4435 domain-containing protein [Pseudoalteromonas xiamenensis]QTH73004.1 DUF4435 domain-containing protein [Pseudoalteromonas xiamenensis]
MSRVEELKKSRDSLSVKFLEFTRVVSKGKVAVFFEGEDEKYYSIRINTICPSIVWAGVNCKGKSNVVDMRGRIRLHETYKNYSCLFFVDSDFDDNSALSGLPDIYTTPCYSVENLYVTDSAFARVLSSEFGVSETNDENMCFEACMSKYRDIKSQYINAIEGFNLLIREIRLMERTGDLVGRLNINNVSIDDLISIGFSGITKVYAELSPNTIFPELAEGLEINLEKSKEYFKDKNGEFWYRGKQNLDFFRIFLSKLKKDRCSKEGREIFQNKGNVKLQLTKSNVISELSQYAETPECLRVFLESFEVRNQVA